jgi:hypothetical protein
MCLLSIYCVLSTPLAGGARATLQTAHLSSLLSKQCAHAIRCTVLIIPYMRSFPCTTRLRRSWVSGRKKIAPAASMSSAKCYICYVHGPTCRGSVFLCMPSLAIKGEAYNVTKQAQSLGLDSQLSSFHNNPTHNGVGCYAPAARTTLKSSRVHVLDVRLVG